MFSSKTDTTFQEGQIPFTSLIPSGAFLEGKTSYGFDVRKYPRYIGFS